MGRLIIVEGADGTGKTTLINKFLEQGAILVPVIAKDSENYDGIFRCWNEEVYRRDEDIVMDRCIFTDMVYRYVKGGKPTRSSLLVILKSLSKFQSVIIHCNNKDCYKQSMVRGENFITDEKDSDKICELYNFLFFVIKNYTNIPVIEYDYDSNISKQELEIFLGGKYAI